MSEDVRYFCIPANGLPWTSRTWDYEQYGVTPERLARAVKAWNESPCCDRHELGAPGAYTDPYPCSACQEIGILAVLASLSGGTP